MRLPGDLVLCTPTLLSKGDLTTDDLCLVDLHNNRLCGNRLQTSEIRMHLAIYRDIPRAHAVVHCHPPYSTAHAIAGVAPTPHLLPEQEIFVGPVPIVPYQTPGTDAFADSVAPFATQHPVMLLANHGVVAWADTVTHAEWAVEVLETYCQTALLARQLNPTLNRIPDAQLGPLLTVKQRLNISDPRLASQPAPPDQPTRPNVTGTSPDESRWLRTMAEQVLAFAAAGYHPQRQLSPAKHAGLSGRRTPC